MKKTGFCLGVLLFSLSFSNLTFALDRFVMGSYGNGIPLSGKTVEEAKSYLEGEYSKNYILYIKGRDKTETIKGSDIGYRLSAPSNLQAVLELEEKEGLTDKADGRYDFSLEGSKASFDDRKLKEKLKQLSFIKESKKTSNAYIDKESGNIIPEVEGNSLNEEKFYEQVYSA